MASTETNKRVRPKAIIAKSSSIDTDKMLDESGSTKQSEAALSAKAHATFDKNTKFNGIIETITQDKFKHVSHEWSGAREKFPQEKSLWYVDYYYPYAKGGPLYVDQIKNLAHEQELMNKKEAMKLFGHRYLQVGLETQISDALEQLA